MMYEDETPEQRKARRHRQKRAVRALQAEMGVNYTTALREYERMGDPDPKEKEWIRDELQRVLNLNLDKEWHDYWMNGTNSHLDLDERYSQFWQTQRNRIEEHS